MHDQNSKKKEKRADLRIAATSEDFLEGRKLILEYVSWLGIDLSFQNFNDEINNLKEMYSEPNGALVLASINEYVAGVAGIRKFDDNTCELKRMFVRSSFRNRGLGKQLLSKSTELAKKFHYEAIKLDTADFMREAIKLYQQHGFKEITAYRYNPHESARYFELQLEK